MNKTAPETLDVEVFRAGNYGPKGEFRDADLQHLAADYDPAVHEAPVTLDHLQDGPAEGWVKSLRAAGGKLVATLAGLSPRLRELVGNGGYKKRSIELYRAFKATERPYLKAVSFLGAAAPEVKGLADPVFADDDPQTLRFIESPDAPALEEEPDPNTPRAAAEAARQRLVDARRWKPDWENAGLMAVFTELGPGPLLNSLVNVLTREDPPVAFGETPADTTQHEDALAGYVGSPSPESLERHHRAMAFKAHNPTVSYTEALLRTAR